MTSVHVVDLETSISNRGEGAIGKMAASPHSPKNRIVWAGMKPVSLIESSGIALKSYINKQDVSTRLSYSFGVPDMLVGQNVKFDLLYIMKADPEFRENVLPSLTIWDTQLVEYLLTGQESTMVSLDTLALKYGGTLKDDRMKEFWSNGVETADIDDDLVKDYLKGDLDNTELVFLGQLKAVKELGMEALVKTQMDALLATTEMEYNGMHFDKEGAMKYSEELACTLDKLYRSTVLFMAAQLPTGIHTPMISPSSPTAVSTVLFGGEVSTFVKLTATDKYGHTILYKSGPKKGHVKTTKKIVKEMVNGLIDTSLTTPTKRKGVFSVNDNVLKSISAKYVSTGISKFCDELLEYRQIAKDKSTYYDGYSALVWPHDSCIHPQFNHCITSTGRLSHSAPNLGNVSHNDD